jgi:tetratricopeptide (TPR) repeat protein
MLNRTGADRYDLHLSVWQYAAEKLAEQPDDEAQTRARHSSFYANVAREQAKHAHSREERTALAAVSTEFENIRVGYHWAIRQRNGRDLADYADCLAWFTEVFSRFHDGAALATEAIDALNVDGPLDDMQTAAAALLLVWRGRCYWRVQSVASSVADLRKALDLAKRLPESLRATRAFVYMMVIVSNGLNDFDEAGDLGLEAIRIFRERNDIWGVAQIWPFLGMGDFELTKQRFEETLAMRRQIGDDRGVGLILTEMGEMAHHDGWFAEAMTYYDEAIRLAHQHSDRFAEALALDYAGYVARQMGNFDGSRDMHQRSLGLSREIGDQVGIAGSLNNLGLLAFDQGNMAEARRLMEQALAISRRAGPDFMITWTQESLAEVELAEGHVSTAEARAQESLTLEPWWTGALRAMGNVRLTQGRFDKARQYFVEAIRQSQDNNVWHMTRSVLGLAHLAEAEGDLARAAELTAFLLGHRSSDHAVRAKAQALRERLAEALSPDVLAAAEARDANISVEAILQDLACD